MDMIEVRDNGRGIKREDTPYMARPHYTSKLKEMDDFCDLRSYGFRGEALGAVAMVSDLSITTCTNEDDIAFTYTIDRAGQVQSSKPSSLGKGTTVSVTKLFGNLPVRKQYYKNSKMTRESFKKIENMLMSFGLVHPGVHFILKHNRSVIWQKIRCASFQENAATVFGTQLFQGLCHFSHQCSSPVLSVFGYVPRPKVDPVMVSRNSYDRFFLLVNKRPVTIKPVMQVNFVQVWHCPVMIVYWLLGCESPICRCSSISILSLPSGCGLCGGPTLPTGCQFGTQQNQSSDAQFGEHHVCVSVAAAMHVPVCVYHHKIWS